MAAAFTFSYDRELRSMRVSSESAMTLSKLMDVFTVPNPSYFFMQSKGNPYADESLEAITPTGAFKPGLFPLVYKAAVKIANGQEVSVVEADRPLISKACMPLKGVIQEGYEVADICEVKPLHWYQRESVASLLKHGCGVCVSPTGSGKSLIIATLIAELRKNGFPAMEGRNRILVMVPTRQLVDQMAKDFADYGLGDVCSFTSNSGKKSDGTFVDNSCAGGFANVVISNHAWLAGHSKDAMFKKAGFGCVIADEVHTVSHKSKAMKLVEKLASPLRFGFTGTLPDFEFDRWVMFGTFGIPVFCTQVRTLQDEKFITPLEVHPYRVVMKELVGRTDLPFSLDRNVRLGDVLADGTVVEVGTAYSMEQKFIEDNAARMYPPVFSEIDREYDFSRHNTIVLFDRTNVGHALESELKRMFEPKCRVRYTDGATDVSVRETIRSELEAGVGNIYVAQTVTASTGLNIRNLHGIVFAFSGRSYVRVIQSIGRVLRRTADKHVAKLFEVWYNMRYSTQHHSDKMEMLRATYGDDCFSVPSEVII